MLLTILTLALAMSTQHGSLDARGAMVMGFDQTKAAHHFYLYPDGGAIDISVKNASDGQDRDAIRSHLSHIASMFGEGYFDAPMLVHDTKDVPGIAVLSARKDRVAYRYAETSNGGRVDIVTNDADALEAAHAFLCYQIREHHTGDVMTVQPKR